MQLLQQVAYRLFSLFDVVGVAGGDGDVLGVLRAEQADAGRRVGDGDAIVAVQIARCGAFFLQHADHLKRHVFDQDVLADRVALLAEQFLANLVTNHCHGGCVLLISLAEITAFHHRPVEDRRKVRVITADVTGMIEVAVAHPGLAAVDRHDHFHLGQLAQRSDFLQGDDALGRTRVGRLAVEVNDVGAERGHLRHDLTFAAFADSQHHHH